MTEGEQVAVKGKRIVTGRQILSKRRQKGSLELIDRTCPYCNHGKAYRSPKYIKCTRCGTRILP